MRLSSCLYGFIGWQSLLINRRLAGLLPHALNMRLKHLENMDLSKDSIFL